VNAAPAGRRLLGLEGCDQWVRGSHTRTTVDGASGLVGLHWEVDDVVAPVSSPPDAVATRGLAFDRFCRGYRGRDGNVERTLLGTTRRGVDYARVAEPVVLFADTEPVVVGGGFGPADPPSRDPLRDPAGLAVDADDRLVVSQRGRRRLVVVDLWSRRVVHTVDVTTPEDPEREPWGIAARGTELYVVTRGPAGLLRLTARGEPRAELLPVPLAPDAAPDGAPWPVPAPWEPARVTVPADGEPVVLFTDPGGEGLLVMAGRPAVRVGPATDLATDGTGAVVVAPAAGGPAMQRFVPRPGLLLPAAPLDAAGYDGGGIAATTDGRIAFTTAAGLRLAVGGRMTYAAEGRVVSYRLDSGRYGNRWGRLFLAANVPTGTDLRCSVRTSDDEDETAIAAQPADPAGCTPYRPEVTPPLPPPRLDVDVPLVVGAVGPRALGPVAWWRPDADDCLTTFEGYPTSAPGRYAWVSIRLTGNTRATPLVGSVRMEAEAHTLMRRLPRLYSADATQESFLHRYLALFDGQLFDVDQRSLLRDLLVDPASTPEEALDWLASFLGLVLDDRWPEGARRQLISEAATLFRRRGTVGALSRYLELYLGVVPVIVEHYRLRGMAAVTDPDTAASAPWFRSALGYGFRVGWPLGQPDPAAAPTTVTTRDALSERYAHRFSVIVPRLLDAEQEAVVRLVLARERPAHTTYELCTLDSGMRAGSSMHLGLTSVVGASGGFTPAVLGEAALDHGRVLGTAQRGGVVEAARAGRTEVG